MGTLTSAAVKDRYTKLVWYNTSDNKLYKTTEDGTDADSLLSSVYLTGVRLTDNILRSSDGTTAITLDGASATIGNNLEVIGEIKLKTDGEDIRFGEHGEVWLSHNHNTGLKLNSATSLTNTSVSSLLLVHQTIGTPAAGIGADIGFSVETTASNHIGMKISAITTDVGDGAEDFDYVLSLMEGGSGAAERMRVTSAGDLSISGDIKLANQKKLYLDGGTHTYFHESSNDIVQLVSGVDNTGSNRIFNMAPKSGAGIKNTVYGQNAGSNIDGNTIACTYFGANTGDATHDDADGNTGMGSNCLTNLTTGKGNTFLGRTSGFEITTSNYSVGIGSYALQKETIGAKSVAVGYNALGDQDFNGEGDSNARNVAVGYYAGKNATTGKDNVMIGWKAGYDAETPTRGTTTGSENIFIGGATEASASTTDNEIVIGYNVTGVGANQIIIGNTSHTDMWISDQFNFDIANTEFVIHDDQDTGDLFSIQVAQHGATTIKTIDDDAAAGHLTLDTDGDIILDPNSGVTKFYKAGDTDDLCTLTVGANGKTTIETFDSDGAQGHLELRPDGIAELYFNGTKDSALHIKAGSDLTGQNGFDAIKIELNEMSSSSWVGDGETMALAAFSAEISPDRSLHANGTLNIYGTKCEIELMNNDGTTNHYGSFVEIDDTDALSVGFYSKTKDDANSYDFMSVSSADTGDYFSIATGNNGATTIKTVDDNAAVAHLNIEADGHVEFDNCSVGFDLLTPTYNASDTDVSFINGNKQFVTFGSGNITDLNLIFPKTSGNFTLLVKQDGTGSRTITNYKAWDIVNSDAASGSATVKFAGGSNPTLTTDANHVDILSFFWDADNQIAYGVATLDFQF